MRLSGCALLLTALLFAACNSASSSSDGGPPDADQDGDLGAPEVRNDAGPRAEDALDVSSAEDGAGETLPDTVEPACDATQGVLLAPDSGTTKFALSLFHYNLQYVAGGLEGFTGNPAVDLPEQEVEDAIIVESLVPIFTILEEHPTWGMDVEMQGMMVDAMRERHPAELDRMRALVRKGQLHVNSFHYSDQLWTAYPYHSMDHSQLLNLASFERACLPLGRSVFTQEGQFGHGLARLIHDSGRIGLYPKNLFKYCAGGDHPGALAYQWDGTPVVIAGKGVSESAGDQDIEVTWHFMNDGELAFTGNANPYFGSLFVFDPEGTAKYVAELEQLEADGWTIATVADYVAHLEAYGYEPQPLPLTIDGTWQPKDTQNVYRWMGQAGDVGGPSEDDNLVLTTNVRSRLLLQAAAAAAQVAGVPPEKTQALLDEGWRNQLLAEVSDSTGWNPWVGEIEYSLSHSALAAEKALAVLALARAQAGGPMAVDTATNQAVAGEVEGPHYEIEPDGSIAFAVLTENGDEPLAVTVEGEGWLTETTWRLSGEMTFHTLTISLSPDPESETSRLVKVTFPRFSDTLRYVPALLEKEGTVTTFDITDLALDASGYLGIGLANGLLDLGEGRWLIKVTASCHLAALVPKASSEVWFRNETMPVDLDQTWTFLYLETDDPSEAVALANRVNVNPVLRLSDAW